MEPQDIYERVKLFVNEASFLDEEVFSVVKTALIHELEEPFKTMDSQYMHYWSKISDTSLAFDYPDALAAAIDSVTYSDLKRYYLQHFVENPRWLQIHINQSDQHDSVSDFKSDHKYMPVQFK